MKALTYFNNPLGVFLKGTMTGVETLMNRFNRVNLGAVQGVLPYKKKYEFPK